MNKSQIHKRFFHVYTKLQTPNNGRVHKPLDRFLQKHAAKYRVPLDEIKSVSLLSIYRAVLNNQCDETLEAYVWKSIRNSIISYVKERNTNKYKMVDTERACTLDDCDKYMHSEIIEQLDLKYSCFDNHIHYLEFQHDFNQTIKGLNGAWWALANLIMIFGDKPSILCKALGFSRATYNRGLEAIRTHFVNCGYNS